MTDDERSPFNKDVLDRLPHSGVTEMPKRTTAARHFVDNVPVRLVTIGSRTATVKYPSGQLMAVERYRVETRWLTQEQFERLEAVEREEQFT